MRQKSAESHICASLGSHQALSCCRQGSGHALLYEIRACLSQAWQISQDTRFCNIKQVPEQPWLCCCSPPPPGEAAPGPAPAAPHGTQTSLGKLSVQIRNGKSFAEGVRREQSPCSPLQLSALHPQHSLSPLEPIPSLPCCFSVSAHLLPACYF